MWQNIMVSMRSRLDTRETHEQSVTALNPNAEASDRIIGTNRTVNLIMARPPGMTPLFEAESVLNVTFGDPDPLLTLVTQESRMMETMMKTMHEAMVRQQEQFMKILEDRDVSNRRHEIVADNAGNVGSGGT